MKVSGSSEIFNTIYHNGSYLYRYLEKENHKVFKFHVNNSLYIDFSLHWLIRGNMFSSMSENNIFGQITPKNSKLSV